MCLALVWEERPLSLPPLAVTCLDSVGKQLTFAPAERDRERERRERESKSVGSAANNTSYTVLQASSHVFSQQEAELSLHFAFGNEFISVVNTVECFFISSLSLLSLSSFFFLHYIRFGHSQLLSLKFS